MEGAIKTARQYFYETGQPQRTKYIGRKISYHGASLGTLGVAFNGPRRAPYEPILDQETFHHVSPPYARRFKAENETEEQFVERLRNELDAKFQELGPDTVIACEWRNRVSKFKLTSSSLFSVVAETVTGASSGVVIPPKGYFKAVKSVCDKYGALLILDEVMCGMGREFSNCNQPYVTLHLSNRRWYSARMGDLRRRNYPRYSRCRKRAWRRVNSNIPTHPSFSHPFRRYTPMGAVLVSKKVADGMRSRAGVWQHGYTYQAHPLCCAASLAVQKILKKENLLENIQIQGELLGSLLRSRLLGPAAVAAPYVFDIRGKGGFWAVEFDITGKNALELGGKRFGPLVEDRCFKNGMMIMGMSGGANYEGTLGDHCMFAPAYNVTAEEITRIVDIFVQSVEEVIKTAAGNK